MVGMVIAMLGILVMMQVSTVSESQKRTTTGGDDAQNNGAIALFGLQREIRQSGWGATNLRVIGCDVQLRAGVTITNMAPFTINHPSIPAGDPNTDTLLVISGSTNGTPEGDGITGQPATTTYVVQTAGSFQAGDWVIAVPKDRVLPCSGANALILDRIVNRATPNVTVATGVAGLTVPAAVGIYKSPALFNMGQTVKASAYRILDHNLTLCDYTVNDCSAAASRNDPAVWVPISTNIVSLRAHYGRDTSGVGAMDGLPDANGWDQATPSAAASSMCGWLRTSAVRLALVTRSGQYEKAVATDTTNPATVAGLIAKPVWAGEAATGGSAGAGAAAPINLMMKPDGTTDPDWQHYRYRVFQAVLPIRNISWLGVQAGC
jgi:type IV pilus assembly protein PilW